MINSTIVEDPADNYVMAVMFFFAAALPPLGTMIVASIVVISLFVAARNLGKSWCFSKSPCAPTRGLAASRFFFLLAVICFDFFIFGCAAFDRIPAVAAAFLTAVLSCTAYVLSVTFPLGLFDPNSRQKRYSSEQPPPSPASPPGQAANQEKPSPLELLRTKWVPIAAVCVLTIVACFVISFAVEGMCVSLQPLALSSRLSRRHFGRVCTPDALCHVYLTLPEDCSSQLIANFHTSFRTNASVVFGTTPPPSSGPFPPQFSTAGAGSFRMAIDEERWVHYAVLSTLPSDSVIYFRVVMDPPPPSSPANASSRVFSTRTCPAGGGSEVTFVSGGDCGTYSRFASLLGAAAAYSPSAVVVGGDMAYANAMITCYRAWDLWLQTYQTRGVTPSGHLIPMTLAIGNHEGGGWSIPREGVPFYFHYFLQSSNASLMDPSLRKSYHAHTLGANTSLTILDSQCTLEQFDGPQLPFLRATLSRPVANKFAVYHHPLYPSSRPFDEWQGEAGRALWAPEFERGGVKIAFEHHDHTFKRSKRIRNNTVDVSGVLYLGDGSFGVAPRAVRAGLWYIDKSGSQPHVWVVRASSNGTIRAFAVDEGGTVFDSTSLP